MAGVASKGKTYLIIGGTSKAGTSSVFSYLAAHPEICPSFIKQTNYFLEESYVHVRQKSLFKYGEEPYHSFFRDCSSQATIFLEASPDYLYSESALERIKESIRPPDKCIIIFILRSPVTRFVSWYNFGKQIRAIDESVSLEKYFEKNIDLLDKPEKEEAFYATLKTGIYSNYLGPFYDRFSSDQVKTFFFENLKANPAGFMKKLGRELGIDDSFYDSYAFGIANKTVKVDNEKIDNAYRLVRSRLFDFLHKNKFLYKISALPRKLGSGLYRKINTSNLQTSKPPENILLQLEKFYDGEKERIAEFVNKPVPW